MPAGPPEGSRTASAAADVSRAVRGRSPSAVRNEFNASRRTEESLSTYRPSPPSTPLRGGATLSMDNMVLLPRNFSSPDRNSLHRPSIPERPWEVRQAAIVTFPGPRAKDRKKFSPASGSLLPEDSSGPGGVELHLLQDQLRGVPAVVEADAPRNPASSF